MKGEQPEQALVARVPQVFSSIFSRFSRANFSYFSLLSWTEKFASFTIAVISRVCVHCSVRTVRLE